MSETSWKWPSNPKTQRNYVLKLRPTDEEITANRDALGKVIEFCQKKCGLDVTRVKTAGSVGKSTDMRKLAEVELVLFVNGFKQDEMKEKYSEMQDTVLKAMNEEFPNTFDSTADRKFGLKFDIEGMKIEILIGLNDVSPKDFLEVSDPELREYMLASVSMLNQGFIKKQSTFYLDMVRAAKDWCNSFEWDDKDSKPSSYLIEIIMLEALRRLSFITGAGNTGRRPMRMQHASEVMQKFFQLIGNVKNNDEKTYDKDNLPSLFICFTRHYKKTDLPLDEAEPLFENKGKKANAIVMDAVNPTNNLWLTLADDQILVQRAKEALAQLATSNNNKGSAESKKETDDE